MKKIILSAVVTAMALSTTASALEDIKVNGQAKLWYETNNQMNQSMFDKKNEGVYGTSGEVVFKIGVTGKQGNVGFGATVYQTSTMGLEGTLVSGTRDNTTNIDASRDGGQMYTGEMYITAPVGAKTLVKIGKQELDTPLAFTERWNATPNTFNAAVAINNSINNLTLIAAYVGQSSNTSFKSDGEVENLYMNTSTFAAGALYKNDALAVNVWGYELSSTAKALWIDAAIKAGPVALKAYAATMMPAASGADDTTALALSGAMKVGGIKLFAAASNVSDDGVLAVANTATGFKKTKLPTAGVYTDGVFVAVPGSTAFKLKAATKIGTTGIALQAVDNSNDNAGMASKETTEIDLILTQKFGDFNFKAILMDRSFDDAATDAKFGAQHVRVIASVNF